jgi:hypothetical protein
MSHRITYKDIYDHINEDDYKYYPDENYIREDKYISEDKYDHKYCDDYDDYNDCGKDEDEDEHCYLPPELDYLRNLKYHIPRLVNPSKESWKERFNYYCGLDGTNFVQIDPAIRIHIKGTNEHERGYEREDIKVQFHGSTVVYSSGLVMYSYRSDSPSEIKIYKYLGIYIVQLNLLFRVWDDNYCDQDDDEYTTVYDKLEYIHDNYILGGFNTYKESKDFVDKFTEKCKNNTKHFSHYQGYQMLKYLMN